MNFVIPAVACATLFLVGCGQKGPLYLPAQPEVQENAPSVSEQASDEKTQSASTSTSTSTNTSSRETLEEKNLVNDEQVLRND